MITEKFAQTLKTKIAIKNFDRRSEPEMKKQLYKLIEEELVKFKEEEKEKDYKITELKSKIKKIEKESFQINGREPRARRLGKKETKE